MIQPKKNRKGNRLFTVKDIEHFNKIYQLVKEQGYTLDGAKKALKQKGTSESEIPDKQDDLPTNSAVIEKLEAIKKQLIDLKKSN